MLFVNVIIAVTNGNSNNCLKNLNNSTWNENENRNLSFDARSLIFPSVINSSDPVVSYLNNNRHELFKGAVYYFTGDMTYLNSGLI